MINSQVDKQAIAGNNPPVMCECTLKNSTEAEAGFLLVEIRNALGAVV
jgi:hypothetical protein